eukprot:1213317-Prorocentrum_lima.AAC.1
METPTMMMTGEEAGGLEEIILAVLLLHLLRLQLQVMGRLAPQFLQKGRYISRTQRRSSSPISHLCQSSERGSTSL